MPDLWHGRASVQTVPCRRRRPAPLAMNRLIQAAAAGSDAAFLVQARKATTHERHHTRIPTAGAVTRAQAPRAAREGGAKPQNLCEHRSRFRASPVRPDDEACEAVRPVEAAFGKHQLLWLDCLQRVEDGEIKRLMGLMPPGSAKSTYTSIVFPVHVMGRFPGTPGDRRQLRRGAAAQMGPQGAQHRAAEDVQAASSARRCRRRAPPPTNGR